MDDPSDRETAFRIDFIDPALLALPTPLAFPDPPPSQSLSTTSDRHSRGLADESWSPIDSRQEALDEDPSINSAGHVNSNRRQQRECHRNKFLR